MQSHNRQVCYDSLAKYGVRECVDPAAYRRARYARDPEYAERKKARKRKAYAKQKALGRRKLKCPDGKTRWLTDAEYNARYGINQQLPLF